LLPCLYHGFVYEMVYYHFIPTNTKTCIMWKCRSILLFSPHLWQLQNSLYLYRYLDYMDQEASSSKLSYIVNICIPPSARNRMHNRYVCIQKNLLLLLERMEKALQMYRNQEERDWDAHILPGIYTFQRIPWNKTVYCSLPQWCNHSNLLSHHYTIPT
jgi:hypothetical protein